MYKLVLIALGSVIAMLIAAQMLLPERPAASGATVGKASIHALEAEETDPDSGAQTEIARDQSGQFRLTVRVNGQDARFLVDTGADLVALTVEDARNLGVEFDPEAFEPIGRSASGVAKGAKVQLDRFQLGEVEFHNVDAIIIEGLETNLLGQSLLRRLGKVELRGDRMVIHHS